MRNFTGSKLLQVLLPACLIVVAPGAEPGRLLVEVTIAEEPAITIDGDQRPARVELDFPSLIARARLTGFADLSALRMTRVGGATLEGPKFAHGKTPSDLPLRWDDASIATDFPTVEDIVDGHTGKLRYETVRNAGSYYNVASAASGRGRLVWTHRRHGEGPALYRVEVPVGDRPSERRAPMRGWIGDGVARFSPRPDSTTGSPHTRIDVTDWNGDGLVDIVYGENYGKVLALLNHGTAELPAFSDAIFVTDEMERPLDVGISAAPLLADWDDDGREDMLIGTHWNRLLFFKNTGRNEARRFKYSGIVRVDGKPLELPTSPVVGRPAGAFARDYYPVSAMADWDGDKRPDLLAGGYLTGRIYLFRNTGANDDGTRRLEFRGPIEADGQILNVGDWAAAPSFADLNGDGLPDFVTGNYPMTPQSAKNGSPLRLFLNAGRTGEPLFRESPVPHTGAWPSGRMYSPRLADMNRDGLTDLVVAVHDRIYVFLNRGTRRQPSFALHAEFIRPSQGNSPLRPTQFIDWNGDGLVDLVENLQVRLNLGRGDPFVFGPPKSALPRGQEINHPSGEGDGWFHPRLFDFDGDGDHDVLFGDWYGQVWLHRRAADGGFDVRGSLLRLASGEPIKVGPRGLDTKASFRALQGARTVFAAHSFTGDGLTDLVVGDTYGVVRFFKNVRSNAEPVYQEAQVLGDLGNRLSVDLVDWNDDGHRDVICGSANGRVRVFLNRPQEQAGSRFAAGLDPQLPRVTQPRIIPVDLNADGDVDIFIPGTQGSVWLERSFLRHGYAEGRVTSVHADK